MQDQRTRRIPIQIRHVVFGCLITLGSLSVRAEERRIPRAEVEAGYRHAYECARLNAEGKYAEALTTCTSLVPIIEHQVGLDTAEVALALEVVAKDHYMLGQNTEAAQIYERALQIRDKTSGPRAKETAFVLHRLAWVYIEQNQYPRAEPLLRRWVDIEDQRPVSVDEKLYAMLVTQAQQADAAQNVSAAVRAQNLSHAVPLLQAAIAVAGKIASVDRGQVVELRIQLADMHRTLRKFKEAAASYRQALPGAKQQRPKLVPKLLNDLARTYQDLQDYKNAESTYLAAIAIAESLKDLGMSIAAQQNLCGLYISKTYYLKALPIAERTLKLAQSMDPKQDLLIAYILESLGTIELRMSNYEKSKSMMLESLRIRESSSSPYAKVGEARSNLALLYKEMGDYAAADQELQRALEIHRSGPDPQGDATARALSNRAALLLLLGRPEEAERLARESLDLRRKRYVDRHPDVADSLNQLATIYQQQGDIEHALQAYQDAINILKKTISDSTNTTLATYMHNYASTLEDNRQYDEARKIHLEVLSIRQKNLPADHPEIAESLNSLGGLFFMSHEYKKAGESFQQALTILRKKHTENHLTYVSVSNNLGLALLRQADYPRAEGILRDALRTLQTQVGQTHPNLASVYTNLATLHLARGELDAGIAALHKAVAIKEHSLHAVVSEPRALALLNSDRATEDAVYGMLLAQKERPDVLKLALALTLLRKGRSLDVGRAANLAILRHLHTEEDKRRGAELEAARRELEQRLFRGARGDRTHDQKLHALELRAAQLEHDIASALPKGARLQPPALDDIVAQVASQLPARSALLEIVRAREYNPRGGARIPLWGAYRYVALLLFPSGQIIAKDLAPQSDVDRQVGEAVGQLQQPGSGAQEALHAVYRSTFEKIEGALANRDIARLYISADGSLNMLPWDALWDGKQFLIERHLTVYLTAGRDLLQPASASATAEPLVLGNPNYATLARAGDGAKGSFYSLIQNVEELGWTKIEAAWIAKQLNVEPLVREAASESALRAHRAPRILHLATHGIFMDDRPTGSKEDSGITRALVPKAASADPIAISAIDNPLLRSALLLSGATSGASSRESDGVVTADEVRALDLFGTELVALSACETARGGVSTGQGVYGLRRAFFLAGTETLISTLWTVRDQDSAIFMRDYYERLLKGSPRITALRDAMMKLRATRPHPYFWASYMGIGRDAPLTLPASRR